MEGERLPERVEGVERDGTRQVDAAEEPLTDDDGVVVVRRADAEAVLQKSAAREAKEAETRQRLKAGELGVDIYGMRAKLAEKGLKYRD